MILVEGEKYACVQCIRGHRSSTCQHTKRPLVQVRSRGRPNSGMDHRVTVFPEHAAPHGDKLEEPKACCSSKKIKKEEEEMRSIESVTKGKKSCCSSQEVVPQMIPNDVPMEEENLSSLSRASSSKAQCGSLAAENQPVIVLKASRKQLFNVTKGSLNLLGPVSADQIAAVKKLRSIAKAHNGKCNRCSSQSLHTKTPKNPVRARSMEPSISSLSIKTESDSLPNSRGSMTPDTEYFLQPVNSNFGNDSFTLKNQVKQPHLVYDLVYAKSCCVVPGSCCCETENCSCDGCSVHNVPPFHDTVAIPQQQRFDATSAGQINFNHFQIMDPYQQQAQQHSFNNSNGYVETTPPIVNNNANNQNFDFARMLDTFSPMDDCSCLPEDCACYNCPKHLIVDGVRLSDGVKVASTPTVSYGDDSYSTPDMNYFDNKTPDLSLNKTTISNLLFNEFSNEETIDMMEDCSCPADNCNCVNCFKHGIFNNEVVNFETPALNLVPATKYNNDSPSSNGNTNGEYSHL